MRRRPPRSRIGALLPATERLLSAWQSGAKQQREIFEPARQKIRDLREKELDTLYKAQSQEQVEAAQDPEAPSDFLRWLSRKPDVWHPMTDDGLRMIILQNPNLGVADALEILSDKEDYSSYYPNKVRALLQNPAFDLMLLERPDLFTYLLSKDPHYFSTIVAFPEVQSRLGTPTETLTFERANADKKRFKLGPGVLPAQIDIYPFLVTVHPKRGRRYYGSFSIFPDLGDYIAKDQNLPRFDSGRSLRPQDLRDLSDQTVPASTHGAVLSAILMQIAQKAAEIDQALDPVRAAEGYEEASMKEAQALYRKTVVPLLLEYKALLLQLCQAIPKRPFFANLAKEVEGWRPTAYFPSEGRRIWHLENHMERAARKIPEFIKTEYSLDKLRSALSDGDLSGVLQGIREVRAGDDEPSIQGLRPSRRPLPSHLIRFPRRKRS